MRLFVITSKQEKVYLSIQAETRFSLSYKLKSATDKFKLTSGTYSFNDVQAETELFYRKRFLGLPIGEYMGAVIGAIAGAIAGPIGIIVGVVVGHICYVKNRIADQEAVDLFNNSPKLT